MEYLRLLAKYQHAIDILGGTALIGFGLYMLNPYFFFIHQLAGYPPFPTSAFVHFQTAPLISFHGFADRLLV